MLVCDVEYLPDAEDEEADSPEARFHGRGPRFSGLRQRSAAGVRLLGCLCLLGQAAGRRCSREAWHLCLA